MGKGTLLTLLPHPLLPTPFPFPPIPNPKPNSNPNVISTPSLHPLRRLHLRRPRARGSSGASWGSNAEDVRARRSASSRGVGEGSFGKKGKRKWWSDDPLDRFEDVFDAFDDEPEQLWDRIWIFKVFKSYGYLLPAIIASMLLATGPKAFLMALALPLGQSALSLAFDKLFGRENERPRPQTRSRKKPADRYGRDFVMWEEDDTGEPNRTKQGPKSWAATDSGAAKKGEKRASRYGGWDELDRVSEFRKAPASSQSPRETSNSSARTQVVRKEKVTRRGRNKDMPLFIRLLIAVFPFLGSWTKLL